MFLPFLKRGVSVPFAGRAGRDGDKGREKMSGKRFLKFKRKKRGSETLMDQHENRVATLLQKKLKKEDELRLERKISYVINVSVRRTTGSL